MLASVAADNESYSPPTGGLLSKERIVAGPGFNRWYVPPAALAIHLCIGMAYGFSVFWLPMTHLVAGADAAACKDLGFWAAMTTGSCDWTVPQVTHIFETFIAMLGISAALWGGWLEHAGPRKAGFIAALCWGGGLVVGGIGVSVHQLWLVYLGCGVLGGVGQGLGYITPVSTLIKWFPDRRGMATGFAIMGYGGGAMIGAPLAVALMKNFAPGGTQGVSQTLIAMGILYFVVMSAGAFGFRVAPSGWRPAGWTPSARVGQNAMITQHQVHLSRAWKTPQFWLIWAVLCLNVTAGIGVISMASPMFQEVFGSRLLGVDNATVLDAAQKARIVAAAAGLVGLISLFNSVGRLFWASLSDKIGRKTTYCVFFVLGMALYCSLPALGHLGLAGAFVFAVCVILTMYGGGCAMTPPSRTMFAGVSAMLAWSRRAASSGVARSAISSAISDRSTSIAAAFAFASSSRSGASRASASRSPARSRGRALPSAIRAFCAASSTVALSTPSR
ncbi:MAG TPA: OFA family MFS transporter, partial [Burkholderiaceae bacterium]|nr:OFA family MFS transporter [Burkholderiaceae bacterium]